MRGLSTVRYGFPVVVVTAMGLLAASSAHGLPVGTGNGSQQGQELHAEAEAIQWDESKNGSGDSVGPLTTTSGTWTPPPCWYAPTWDPEQFRAWFEVTWDLDQFSAGHEGNAAVWMWNHYEGGDPYEDYNSEEAGNGMWWGTVENPNEPNVLRRTSCSHIPFWVENGEVPEVENALSPEVLAGLAYERVRVPDTEVRLSPGRLDGQIVNLPTWVWAEAGDFSEVSVTARLASWGIWATTTARPTALTLDPGTEDARVFPGSEGCAINADGSIGEPYATGRAGQDPPCGLTYLRATHHVDAYPLTAAITWEVSWEGSGGTGGVLPDATFETTHEVQVSEAQTIVR